MGVTDRVHWSRKVVEALYIILSTIDMYVRDTAVHVLWCHHVFTFSAHPDVQVVVVPNSMESGLLEGTGWLPGITGRRRLSRLAIPHLMALCKPSCL